MTEYTGECPSCRKTVDKWEEIRVTWYRVTCHRCTGTVVLSPTPESYYAGGQK